MLGVGTTPYLYNVTMVLADTEYSRVLPVNCRKFLIKCRGNYPMRVAFLAGTIGVTWLTVPAGMSYWEDLIYRVAQTLYFRCATAGQVAEIVVWNQDWENKKMPITGAPPPVPDVPVAVRVYRSTDQAILNTTWTDIIFDNQRWDDPNDDQWAVAPNPTRLTCQFAGPYVITGNIRWAGNNVGTRLLRINLNGITTITMIFIDPVAADITVHFITTTYKLAVGDFVELGGYQSSGGALNIDSRPEYSPEFSMVRCV